MSEESVDWSDLMFECRWVVLGTIDEEGAPFLSNVAVAPAVDADHGVLLMHLSDLAAHTKNLVKRPKVSLLFSQTDTGESKDPQTLARLAVSGEVERIESSSTSFVGLARDYTDRFPDSGMRFSFGDFNLYRIKPIKGHYVGGFGVSGSYSAEQLSEGLKDRLQKV